MGQVNYGQEPIVEVVGGKIITRLFWKCACRDNNIHHTSVERCLECGWQVGYGPDANVYEVLALPDRIIGASTRQALIEALHEAGIH